MSDFNLTPEQKEVLEKEFLLKKLANKEQLRLWCIKYLDVDLSDCVVSRFSDSNPLDMVWAVYSFCLDSKDKEPLNIRFIAGRASQKTLSLAVLQILGAMHFKRGVVHFGGTKPQAKRAYSYFKKFVVRKYIKDFLKSEPTQEKTYFIIDNEEIEIEILSLSSMAVQGAHQPLLGLDELASLSPDKVAAYEDIGGIPIYTEKGEPWVTFGVSSRKGRHTVIEKEYESRHNNDIKFKFWTVFENTRRCTEDISGSIDTIIYADALLNIAHLEKDFEKLSDEQKSNYTRCVAKDKCINCPLAAQCTGDLTRQTSTCRTLRPVRAVIKQFKQAPSLEWWLSQAMSMQPSAEGLIFPKFKREIFEKTPNEIYQIFTGQESSVVLSNNDIIRFLTEAGVKRYAGNDHGYSHPETVCVVFEDTQNNMYVMKAYSETSLEPPEVVEAVRALKGVYDFSHLYSDSENPGINKMLEKISGLVVKSKFKKSPKLGIDLIRGKISPTFGKTKLYGLKGECEPLIDNFEKYRRVVDGAGKLTDDAVKEDDDSIDALSYAAQNRWSQTKSYLSVEDSASLAANQDSKQPTTYKEQYDHWFKQQIQAEIKGVTLGQESGVKTGKGGGIYWDI